MTISLNPGATRFSRLPVPMKNSTGARVGDTIYAGLGTAGTSWYALDLTSAELGWAEMAAFPGFPREQARAVPIGGQIYVFAGVGKSDTADMMMFDDVHRYDPVANVWHKQPTRSPLGQLGSVLWSPDGRQILSVGGANKAILDGYFADMAAADGDAEAKNRITAAYFDRPPQDYLFTADVLSYTPDNNKWRTLGKAPFPPTVGSAIAVDAKGRAILVNGEIKPGLRSYQVKTCTLDDPRLGWGGLPDLPRNDLETAQEGVAGAYAGHAGDVLLVAGGTNFPGSWEAFRAGDNWAHKGLTKTWHDTIFALVDESWRVVGRLPDGMGHGLSFEVGRGVLLVGGELQGGEATDEVMLLGFDGVVATIG